MVGLTNSPRKLTSGLTSGWSVLFPLAWLSLSAVYLTTGGFVNLLLSVDSLGLTVLVYKFHSGISGMLDPRKGEDDDNFYEDDKGVRVLVAATSLLVAAYWTRTYGLDVLGLREDPGIVQVNLTEVLPPFPTIGSLLILGFPALVLGVYVYLTDRSVGGPLYRTMMEIQFNSLPRSRAEEYEKRLQAVLSGRGSFRHRVSGLSIAIAAVGVFLYCVAFIMGVLVFVLLAASRLIIFLVALWLVFEIRRFYRGKPKEDDPRNSILSGVDEPQSWFLDLRMMKGGLKSLTATVVVSLGLVFSILYLLIGLVMSAAIVFGLPDAFESSTQSLGGGLLESLVSLGVLTLAVVLVLVVAFIPGVYSLLTWYTLKSRMPLWLTNFGVENVEDVEPDGVDYLHLPRYVTVLYPLMLFSPFLVGGAVVALDTVNLGDVVFLLLTMTVLTGVAVLQIRETLSAWRRTRRLSVILNPGLDNYRLIWCLDVSLMLLVLAAAASGETSSRTLGGILVFLVGITMFYFSTDVALHTPEFLHTEHESFKRFFEGSFLAVALLLMTGGVSLFLQEILAFYVGITGVALIYLSILVGLFSSDVNVE